MRRKFSPPFDGSQAMGEKSQLGAREEHRFSVYLKIQRLTNNRNVLILGFVFRFEGLDEHLGGYDDFWIFFLFFGGIWVGCGVWPEKFAISVRGREFHGIAFSVRVTLEQVTLIQRANSTC